MISVKEVCEKVEENNYDFTELTDEECELFNRFHNIKKHKGRLMQHFKGKPYLILDLVEHTETGEELVIYQAMYGDYKKYARPIDMFISKVDRIKYPEVKQEYRFEFCEIG